MKELTNEDLENMHEKLRQAFNKASGGFDSMCRRGCWDEDDHTSNRNVNIASSISALANAAEALLAVDRELRERDERENGIKSRRSL